MARNEYFGQLLSKGIHRIKQLEAKPIGAIQDELGYAIGKETGGSSIEHWRKGFIPGDLNDLAALVKEIVRRTDLGTAWALELLSAAQFPYAEQFCQDLLLDKNYGPSDITNRHIHPFSAIQVTSPFEIGKRYALLVGVRDYVDPSINRLPNTVNDVIELEKVLTKASYTVLALHSAQSLPHLLPTRANIWAGLAQLLANVERNDLLLIHFGGHGDVWEGQAYLLASDTRYVALQRTGISLDELRQEIEAAKVQVRILLMDACHSGLGRSQGVMDPEFERHIYLQAAGSATLAACRRNQKAYEYMGTPHGVFTYFVLEGLSGAASIDQRFVTFQGLNNYVTDRVKRYAFQQGYQQTPNAQTQLEGDPPLIVLPAIE